MAEEEPLEEGAEAPKKSKSKMIIIIVVILVLLLGVGGFVAMKMMGADEKTTEKSTPSAEGNAKEADASVPADADIGKLGDMVALDPIIVNLSGESGKRYLKITMQLEMNNASLAEEINNKIPQIKDAIITVLSSKGTDELLTVEGKFLLKEQLLTRVNSLLSSGVVKNVYFVEFVIQ